MSSNSYLDELPENDYWYEIGFQDGYLMRPENRNGVPTKFVADFDEGYEEGAYERTAEEFRSEQDYENSDHYQDLRY